MADNGIKYGTKIDIEQTTKIIRELLLVYIESDFKKFELSLDTSASKKMRITGYSLSCTTGNGWDASIIPLPKSKKIL